MFFAVMLVIALYKLYKLYNRRIAFYYEVLKVFKYLKMYLCCYAESRFLLSMDEDNMTKQPGVRLPSPSILCAWFNSVC